MFEKLSLYSYTTFTHCYVHLIQNVLERDAEIQEISESVTQTDEALN